MNKLSLILVAILLGMLCYMIWDVNRPEPVEAPTELHYEFPELPSWDSNGKG